MPALVLDSGALSALAGSRSTAAKRRVRALLLEAHARDLDVVVPTAVLAETYRGDSSDAAVDRILNQRGVRAMTTGRRIVRTAGALRHRFRLDSCHVVDCLVLATTVRLGGGVVATGDPDDMRRLAAVHPNVVVQPIGLGR
jgi:predicted nucleic acid-binding protein